MYSYTREREKIFTDDGQKLFLEIRDRVQRLISQSGAIRLGEAIQGSCGDTWMMLACVDRLVELKEIREIRQQAEVASQHRIFVAC